MRAKGRAASKARATRSTIASSCAGPMICNPIGRPAWVSPQGMLMAGCMVMLKG